MSDGLRTHLAVRDTRLVYVSRGPIERIATYRARKGWTSPWYSSFASRFSDDFHVTLDEAVAPAEDNDRARDEWAERDPSWAGWTGEQQPGLSCFLRVDDSVFHTYSSFGRGVEWADGSYASLDLTALGRQEDWEEPRGPSDAVRRGSPAFAS